MAERIETGSFDVEVSPAIAADSPRNFRRDSRAMNSARRRMRAQRDVQT